MKKITDRIYYVGVADPDLQHFDIVIETEFGTTYNSYIVKGEKTALIETVHDKFSSEFIRNIEEITPVSEIDYVICNHTEPDHSGVISYIIEKNPDVVVVGTIAALKNLQKMLGVKFNELLAKDNSVLSLGDIDLKFIITPNLHWPDTMMTYIESEKALFSCDFLGAHYTDGSIIDKEICNVNEYRKAFKDYYNAILSPFKPFVTIAANKIRALEFDKVLCGHGPVLTDFIKENIDSYLKWSVKIDNSPKKISIFYLSAYGYTKKLAEAAYAELSNGGYSVKIYDVAECLPEVISDAVESSDGILLGTPTINRNALKPIWDIVTSLDLVKAKDKSFAVFGSYGWSGEGAILVNNLLKSMRLSTADEPFRVIFNPDGEAIQKMQEFVKAFAENL